MINEILNQAVGPFIAIFLVTAMFSLGLDLTIGQIGLALRKRRLVLVSLLVNFVAIPLLAIAISRIIPMERALQLGIVLYAFSAGTEGGPKFVQMVQGNTAFAFGLLVLMLIFTVTLVPLLLAWVMPGAHIPITALIGKLLLVVALPIGLGLYINGRYAKLAARLNPIFHRLAMVLLWLLFVLLVYVNLDAIATLPTNALLAGLLFFVAAFAVGYLGGGPAQENRRALAIMSFARNGSISMMIAREVFTDDPQVLVMVTVMAAASVILAVLAVVCLRPLGNQPGV